MSSESRDQLPDNAIFPLVVWGLLRDLLIKIWNFLSQFELQEYD